MLQRIRKPSPAAIVLTMLLLLVILLAAPAASGQSNSLVINEFEAKGTEWIELYNPTSSPITIDGWMLSDGEGSEALSGTIAAGGFFSLNTSLALSNDGDEIFLHDDGGSLVDEVAYGDNGGAPLPPFGSSTARSPNGNDTDDFARDWNVDQTPTRDAANDGPGTDLGSSVIINEQNAFSPLGDFYELYNPTSGDIDVTGWQASDGDDIRDLSGVVPAGGYLVFTNLSISSIDVMYLWDDAGVRVDQLGRAGEFENGSLQRVPDGAGPNDGYDFDSSGGGDTYLDCVPTPGAMNGGFCFDGSVLPLTIPEIQGAGHLSPVAGFEVETQGVVTAVAFDGFYVQDPNGDGNDATSDGMRVFMSNCSSGCPAVGDEVRLTDRVDEFIPGGAGTGNLSGTEMSFPDIEVLSTGNAPPHPVIIGLSGRIPPNVITISDDELPVNLQNVPGVFNPDEDGIDFFESLEGMLVTVEDAVAVSAVRSFGNFSSELFTLPNNGHPEIIEPNNVRTDRGGMNLAADSDGYGDTNPERVQIQFDASDIRTGTLFPVTVPSINLGDRLGDVTGVVGYDFGNFEVRAIEHLSITPSGLEPETTSLLGNRKAVTVASYNVLNLNPLPSNDKQRTKLASQIVNNLGSPDVIALQEIQDNNGTIDDGTTAADETLQALVDAIASAGGPVYEFFDVAPADGTSGGVPGGNIRNAFLYNPDRVELDGFVSLTPDVLAEADVSDPNAFDDTRDPLAATFVFDRRPFTVINNHLSSRSGSTPIFGGPQPFVQADEEAREAQVQALNDYVDFVLEDNKDARVIVLGDFNTFDFTNDLTEILPGTLDGQAILKSLLTEVEDDNRYTFIFDGNSQVLDHMFATRSLLEGASFDIVHVNVDFSRLTRDTTASDHDPLVGRFDLSAK